MDKKTRNPARTRNPKDVPVDPMLARYALRELDAYLEDLAGLYSSQINNPKKNFSMHQKAIVAFIYREWIEALQHDPQFGYILNGEYENDRAFTHNVIVEALKQIGGSRKNHILKKMQDNFKTLKIPGYELGALYLPKERKTEYNSGDTIFCFETMTPEGEEAQHIGIADVSGKIDGIKDALDTKSYILMLADSSKGDLSKLYSELNEILVERFQYDEELYFAPRTVSAISLLLPHAKPGRAGGHKEADHSEIRIDALNAGHEAGLIYRAATGEFLEILQENTLLGCFSNLSNKTGFSNKTGLLNRTGKATSELADILENISFEKGKYTLEKGDIILIYSDGLTYSKSRGSDEAIIAAIKSTIHNNRAKHASEIAELIQKKFVEYMNRERSDDVSVVVVKYVGG